MTNDKNKEEEPLLNEERLWIAYLLYTLFGKPEKKKEKEVKE